MNGFPNVTEPPGDPGGVRAGAARLAEAGSALKATAGQLQAADEETHRVWESTAQRMFSILAEGFTSIIDGSSDIARSFAEALSRYAGILEMSQNDVRQARQRLQSVVAATPVGFSPDQGQVASIMWEVERAHAAAVQASRELSSTALGLLGTQSGAEASFVGSESGASFVSRAHASGLAAGHPSAAAFDAQAALIEQQMGGALVALAGLAAGAPLEGGTPSFHPSGTVVGGVSFSSAISMPASTGPMIIGGSSFSSAISMPASTGPMIIGGSSFSSGISTAPGLGGPMIIGGGTDYSSNPAMILTGVIENRNRSSAAGIWERVLPGVPVPAGSGGEILARLLDVAGDRLTTADLAAIGIVDDTINYGIRTSLLPPGWELVREPAYF
jgi:hypothetical protein